jgi:hypothetical protein
MDIAIVVTDSNMFKLRWKCDSSTLLLNWTGTHCWGSRFDLVSFIRFASHQLLRPNFSLLDNFFILDAEFTNLVIISTSKESSLILNDLKTPWFTITMRNVDQLLITSILHDCLNSTVVMTNKNFSIKDINWWGEVTVLKSDLSDKLVFTWFTFKHRNHIIFASWHQSALAWSNCCNFGCMSLKN